MDRTALEERLTAILRYIRTDCGLGLECPPPTGANKPIENLPKFYSKVWPIAPTILATPKKKSPAPRLAHPARTADDSLDLRLRHPARRQYDEARVVGDQTQTPELLLGRPAHPVVARGQLERARRPADQRNLNSYGECLPLPFPG